MLVSCALIAQGQMVLSGTIEDENRRSVAGASVIARKQLDGPILAFALSSTTGQYTLKLTADTDSLWVTVSHLAYASQDKVIVGRPERLDWVLIAHVYELPEITLTQPMVVRKGDTLVFDVSRLRTVQDENVEQVLARIPGITVEPNGRILYQDLPISRFYIEGLDMLEGRYALATRGLNVEAILEVEILERHQPILALDSLISPPNAAINLRLKSTVAFTGGAQAGSGLSPALYLAGGHVFGFQKQQQLNISGMANNAGEQQRNNFRSLHGDASFEQVLISPTIIQPPFRVKSNNALDNREFTGGLNFLRRASPHSQLKFQAYATADHLQYRGRQERIWRDAVQKVRFDELLRAKESLGLLNAQLVYELNQPRFFTKVSIESEKNQVETNVDNEINARGSREDMERDKLSVRGRWEAIMRRGNKAYRLWSRLDYHDETIDLELRPLDLAGTGHPQRQLDRALQTVRERSMKADTYSSFMVRRRQVTCYFKSGIRMHWQRFASDLADLAANGSHNSLGLLFVNDMKQILWAPYLDQDYTWTRKKGEWRLHLPLAHHWLALKDGAQGAGLLRRLMVLQPHAEYLPRRGGLSVKFAFSRDYNQGQLFYNNYILRMNRQFERQAFAVNQRESYEFSLRYQGASNGAGLYYSSRLSLSATRADFIANTAFDSLGQASAPIAASNVQQRASWQNRLETTPWPAFQIKLETYYAVLSRPSNLNDNRVDILIHQAWAEPYLVYSFGKSILSCRPRADFFASNLSQAPIWQAQVRWVFFHQFPRAWGNVNLSFDQYRTTIGQRVVVNQLFNIRYKNNIPSCKLEVSLELNNLTNEASFLAFTQENFYEELSSFYLRPRQFMLKLSRRF